MDSASRQVAASRFREQRSDFRNGPPAGIRWVPRKPREPAARQSSAISVREAPRAARHDSTTSPALTPIRLSLGEPQHPTIRICSVKRSSPPRQPLDISDDRRNRRLARGDRRLVQTPLQPAKFRRGVAGVAGQRDARGAFSRPQCVIAAGPLRHRLVVCPKGGGFFFK